MRKFAQCMVLLITVHAIINYNICMTLDRIYAKLDSLEQIETEVVRVSSFKEHNYRDIDVVIPEHTRISEFNIDTEEQIKEEIRLGEMEMLAQLIHAEAGCEDLEGKCLVADVVLNRVDAGYADGTVEGVIFQILNNGVAQFSTTQDGAYERAGWEMTDSDYLASKLEYEAKQRLDDKVMYFRAGEWPRYGKHAYKHGGHFFCYE